ncbi:MAG TPA: hypothetical protein PKV73_01070 [Agriterribacter sp.]|nr:hypothetical protein [Agriterribacter sp.]
MALINDPRLYSGGSERVNTQPHVALYAQLKAREQAKNEAFDEYLRNVNKEINPAGMRNQEREVFEEKLRQWQDFGMKNRDALRNPRKDNGMASMQFQAAYQDLKNIISESKTREEGKKQIIPKMLDPEWMERVDDDILRSELQVQDAPIRIRDANGQWILNPNSRPIDITRLSFEPKPFDQDDFFKNLQDIKPSKSSQSVKALPGFKEEITTTAEFGPEEYNRIATRAVGRLASDKSFKPFVKTLDPKDFNETFKAAYGRDIENEGDLAAAYALKGMQQKLSKTEIKDDEYAQSLNLEGIKQANRKQLLQMRKSMKDADTKTNDLWIDTYIDRAVEDSKKPQNRVVYKYADGRQIAGYKVPLDPVLRKAVGLDIEKSNGLLLVTEDGEFIIAPYKTDNNYNPKKGKDGNYAHDPEKSSKISRHQLKLALGKTGAGVKQTNLEMLDIEDDDEGILD